MALTVPTVPTGMKAGVRMVAARHRDLAEAGACIGPSERELEILDHLSFRKRRLASPYE